MHFEKEKFQLQIVTPEVKLRGIFGNNEGLTAVWRVYNVSYMRQNILLFKLLSSLVSVNTFFDILVFCYNKYLKVLDICICVYIYICFIFSNYLLYNIGKQNSTLFQRLLNIVWKI